MRYQNYFFDFDGTLYDTYPGMVKAFCEAFLEQGRKLDPKEVYQVMRSESVRAAYRRYMIPALNEAKLHATYKKLEARFQSEARPFPGAQMLLEKIKENGGQSFLLTHRDKSALALLKRDGLAELFCDFSTAADGFKRKPDPEALEYLISKYDLVASQSVMIGDRSLDIEAGHNALMAGILFDPDEMITPTLKVEKRVRKLSEID